MIRHYAHARQAGFLPIPPVSPPEFFVLLCASFVASCLDLMESFLNRKNRLFTGSPRGGRAAAILFSVVASAKRAGLDLFAYLRDLLRRLPSHPHSRIGELLPNIWNKFKIHTA
ncbi:transposase domain-containing protein [Candidatus Sumerlaeota bacterium]|nr:transposase domain-containing protein [Candidatus Sumerlaeota bacterium]